MHLKHKWVEIDKQLDDDYFVADTVTRFYYRCETCGRRRTTTLEGDWVRAER